MTQSTFLARIRVLARLIKPREIEHPMQLVFPHRFRYMAVEVLSFDNVASTRSLIVVLRKGGRSASRLGRDPWFFLRLSVDRFYPILDWFFPSPLTHDFYWKDSPENPVFGFLSQWFSGLLLSFFAAEIKSQIRNHVEVRGRWVL